jgi:hypothetical protein
MSRHLKATFVAIFSLFIGGMVHAAPSNVVYGNLGAAGTESLSSTSTDFGPTAATTRSLAQGFTTGTSNLLLETVMIGAFATSSGTLDRTVSIYSSLSNAPGTALYTSATTGVGTTGKYFFPFSGVTLSPNTNYWVVPDFAQDWTWYLNAAETDPVEQNSSGYSYLGTKRTTALNPAWTTTVLPYSVSIQAVPEPTTFAIAAVGMVAAGAMQWRRRRRR